VAFENHLHPIPDEGVPSSPAWDAHGVQRCVAWRAYREGQDTLKARVGDQVSVLGVGRAVGDPAVLSVGTDTWWVAAPVQAQGAWRCRRFRVSPSGFEPLPDVPVKGDILESVCLRPGLDHCAYLGLAVGRENRSRVQVFRCSDDSAELIMSSARDVDAQRPAIAAVGRRPIAVYDAWDGHAYQVHAQCGERVVQLSQSSGWHMLPDIVADAEDGAWVVWVRTTDVMSLEDAVDARCEIMATALELDDDRGPCVQGVRAVDDMSHGLLDLSPEPRGVMGYLGRRRRPMLLRTPAGVLLLWEQKRVHEGRTRQNVGVLWSRCLDRSEVGEAHPLIEGGMAYTLPGSREVDEDRFEVCCMKGWYADERRIAFQRVPAEPLEGTRVPRDAWRGWRPLELPLPQETPGARPHIEIGGRTYCLFWMDLHAHTTLSADAEGEVDELYRYARHKAGLDGVLMSDNDQYVDSLHGNDWRRACAAAEAFNDPGRFVAFVGYEWTCRRFWKGELITDHRSVILPRPTEDIVRWHESGMNVARLYEFVQREGGLVHAHHGTWRLLGHPVEANIEATSSWTSYLENDPSCFHEHLLNGHRIGLIGGSDSHRRNPGTGGALTGVWAESLTRESILEALRCHRCFATNGRRMMLDFRANGRPMGSALEAGPIEVALRVVAPVPIVSVELIRDGQVQRKWDAAGRKELSVEHGEAAAEDEHFYYVKICLQDDASTEAHLPANLMPAFGARAWSSPVWVKGGA